MTDYRIVCRNMVGTGSGHQHIGQVGTGTTPSQWELIWSVGQVTSAISRGDRFYSVSPSTNAVAMVASYYCPQCGATTLRSGADAVTDNNLDNLGTCNVS